MFKEEFELTRPMPPKARLRCDACGTIGENGKHNSVICRFLQWVDKRFGVKE